MNCKGNCKVSAGFSILEAGGKQYVCFPNKGLYIDRISEKNKPQMIFSTEKGFDTPKEIVHSNEEVRGRKILIYKHKARTRYRRKRGFVPLLSRIVVGG